MYVLSLIYSYVVVCRFCAPRCLITVCLSLLFFHYQTYVFLIFFLCVFFCFVNLLSILCILCFCVFCAFFPFVYGYLFPIFVQVYRPLPQGRNLIALNSIISYHILSYHKISHHISYHIIPYRIVSHHIIYHIVSYISYHISYNIYHVI